MDKRAQPVEIEIFSPFTSEVSRATEWTVLADLDLAMVGGGIGDTVL